jgi:hypothetical protein
MSPNAERIKRDRWSRYAMAPCATCGHPESEHGIFRRGIGEGSRVAACTAVNDGRKCSCDGFSVLSSSVSTPNQE